MLDALGQAKDILGAATLEQEEMRQADLKKQLADAAYRQQDANNHLLGAMQVQGMADTPASAQQLAEAKQTVAQLGTTKVNILPRLLPLSALCGHRMFVLTWIDW